jgi:hypothetical protein
VADSPQMNYGLSPSQLKTADQLSKKLESLRSERLSLERQWRMNLAFYKGRQYVYYAGRKSDRLEELATSEGQMPRHRVRMVSNQIMPGVHQLLAQLTKTKPRLYATPGSGTDDEIRAAQMSQQLMEHWWSDLALDEKLDEALLWSIVASAGYWKISWDPHAAKQMRFTLGPDGQPITDEKLKKAFTAELQKMGVPPQEQVIYMGDVRVDVISPFDVFLDNTASTFEDCKWAICRHALTPDEVKARWGKDVLPDAVPMSPDAKLPWSNSGGAGEKTVRNVYIGYFVPTASMPNGRYVVFTEGNDKKILADEKWPYPFNDLPMVKFAGMRVPGSVYDDAVVTHAIPIQKELNKTISQIIEYKNFTINPVMTAPIGSLRTRRTTEPGQVLEYQPVGSQALKPEFETLPTLPPYVFEHLREIQGRLSETFLSAEVLQGKVPPNVEAGVAIDLLQEMATDKLAPIIKLIELGLARAGQQLLGLAQQHYIEHRTMKIGGAGRAVQVREFYNADINGSITVRAETGSGLPRTRAGRQARIERLVEIGVIPPTKAHKYMDVADLDGLMANFQAQEDLAYRNIDKLIQGAPVYPEGIQQAMLAVNQGYNPDTMMPIESMDEVQLILEFAGLKPQPGIDIPTHMDVMTVFMAGVEFEQLPPEIRQRFFMYFENLNKAMAANRPMPEPQAAHVNYQIKGTIGPSGAASILNQAGVQVTPEIMSEPPLETWVSDSVDKPDMDATGPGQEAEHLSKAAQVALEAQLADAEAKRAALIRTNEHAMDSAHKVNADQRNEELHQAALRKAAAEAEFAEKKAKQGPPKPSAAKPKPKGK